MARSLRLVRLGVWYHITSRGIERRPIFKDDRDRAHFVELLAELVERFRVRVLSYVLMDNHYHLLIELGQTNLSAAMRWLNVSYSVWFNRRHRRAGYLFQGRFKSVIIDPDSWGVALSAYIHLNPVRTQRHGLSKIDRQRDRAGVGAAAISEQIRVRLGRLRGYRWSSYRAFVGLAVPPKWLAVNAVLEKGGADTEQRAQSYRRYVENQVKQGRFDAPWEELQDRIVLGGASFLVNLKKQIQSSHGGRASLWGHPACDLQTIIQCVEKTKREPLAQFKDRYADGGLALILKLARERSGLTLTELARRLELKPSTNISMTIKRYEHRLGRDRAENKLACHAAKMLNARN